MKVAISGTIEIIGGRTRTRTLDPLIKSQLVLLIFCRAFRKSSIGRPTRFDASRVPRCRAYVSVCK